jgi:PAS domain S-box-containing protein
VFKNFIIFIVFIVNGLGLFSRDVVNYGLPFVRHFKIADFGGSVQNWAIAQAPNGLMYFGNNEGLLEYDGRSWRIYSVPNHSAVRTIYIAPDCRIYVGASDEFGYFERNNFGRLIYTSLSHTLQDVNIQTVWKIVPHEGAIYFITGRRNIFKYHKQEIKQLSIPSTFSEFRGFKVDKDFYLFDNYAGLAKIKNDTIYRFHREIFDRPIAVYSILPLDNDHIILGSRLVGLFKVNIKKHTHLPMETGADIKQIKAIKTSEKSKINGELIYDRFQTIINPDLAKNELYYGLLLSNGDIAYSTLKGGAYIIKPSGEFVDRYANREGLLDNSVFALFEDAEYNLWLTSEKGISIMEPSNGFRIFNADNGITGNIISATTVGNNIYVGTTAGLFLVEDKPVIELENIHKVKTVSADYIYILSFFSYYEDGRDKLMFSSLRNIHHYDPQQGKISNVHTIYGNYAIEPYPYDSTVFFIGHNSGITALKRKGKTTNFEVIETFQGFKEHIRGLVFDKKGRLYVSTAYAGLMMVEFTNPKDLREYKLSWYNTDNGLPRNDKNQWALIADTLLALTSEGIFVPEDQNKIGFPDLKFVGCKILNQQLPGKENAIKKIVARKNGDLWIGTENGIAYFENSTKLLLRQPFYRISNSDVTALCLDSEERLWVGSFENLYSYNSNSIRRAEKEPELHFREIVVGQDSILPIYNGSDDGKINIGEISFNDNSLQVKVAYPSYSNSENIRFSFYLEGLERSWSSWGSSDKYSISYLPVGKYTLHAKARNGLGYETKSIIVTLTIAPPWYQTTFAYIIYLFLALTIIFYAIRLNSARLNYEKKKLEQAVNAAISTVEQQKEELMQQSSQLELTNLELDKLSLVARQTDNAVVIMDAKGNYEWINEGFTRMYGYEFDELLNETARNKIGRNSNLKISDLVSIWYGDKKPITYESLNRHRHGNEIWVQTTLTPILNEHAEVIRLIAIDTDINKLKDAEKEIQIQRDEIQNQRDIALEQRDEILQQKIEITDSIRYAERIQKVVLSQQSDIERIFAKSFVLNLPRDIVSGDFFWCHSEGGYRIIGVADCTGHGVPGAFMSLIGVSFLKEIILTRGFFMPDEILNLLRDNIINSLQQTGKDGENKDGMDISLITIDIKNRLLYYAGANTPIYIINQNILTEYQPDKMPISIYRNINQPFTLQTIPIRKNDRVYMFSDGFIDQFGGENGKKLKSAGFKDILLKVQQYDFDEQRDYLHAFLTEWQKELYQVDDILIIGIDLDSGLDT